MTYPDEGRTEQRFWKIIETAAVLCFLAALSIMFIQVISRYAIGVAVSWTDESSRFLFIGSVFLGAAFCQQRSAQIRVTVVLDLMSAARRRWFEVAQSLFTALVAAALVVGCIKMAINASNLRAATIPITFSWLYAVQGLGMALVLLVSLRDAVRLIRAPRQMDH